MTTELDAARQWVEDSAEKYPEEDWRLLRAAFNDLQLYVDPVEAEFGPNKTLWADAQMLGNQQVWSLDHRFVMSVNPVEDMDEFLAVTRAEWPWVRKTGPLPPAHRLMLRVWRARLDHLLTHLRPQRARLIGWHFFEGDNLHDIASRLGITYQAVQQQLAVAIEDLRVALANHEEELRDMPAVDL